MSDERWKRIDRLLQSALSRPPQEREAFLRNECPDDEGVRDEVLSLLAYEKSADKFLEAPPARAPLAPGARLGAYEIRAQIGEGGMGEVYRAHDSRLRRDIALKILPPEAADAERRQRFAREAQAVAALNHPGIVTIHSVEQSGDIHFLTMELVDGQTLNALIPTGGLSLDRLLTLAIPLAEAVGAAHSQGIVHRDLKPANIMVARDGRVKVMDFGLAKLSRRETMLDAQDAAVTNTAQVTKEGRIFGTVAYMSPEQAEGREVDHRSDVFSLGVLLFEMATGRRPFTGDSHVAVLASIVKDTPPLIATVKPGLPTDFARLVTKCLAKDLARRYQSALDLRNDLEEIREGLQSPQGRGGRSMPLRRWRLPVVATAVAMIAISSVVYFAPSVRHFFWPPPPNKANFAIMLFQNATGDSSLDRIGRRMTDAIAADVHSLGGGVRTIPILESSISADSARRIARAGVGRVVVGTYYLDGDTITVHPDVREVGTDESVYPFLPIKGSRTDPAGLVDKVAGYLKGAVALDQQTDWNGRASRTRPIPYLAWAAVERAMTAERAGAERTSEPVMEYLRKARELARDAFLPKLLLFNRYVWSRRGEDAEVMLKEMEEIYADQTTVSQAAYRHYRAVAKGDLRSALNEAEQLAQLEEYEFLPLGVLVEAQIGVHYLNAAAVTYRQRLAMPIEPGSEQSRRQRRVDSLAMLAEIDHDLETFQVQLEDAKGGQREFPESPIFLVHEAKALVGLNRPIADIKAVIDRASASGKLLPPGQPLKNNGASLASVLGVIADELRAHGRPSEAMELAPRAVDDVKREIAGTVAPTPGQMAALRAALMRAQDWTAAYSQYSEVVNADPNNFIAKGNLGVVAAALGKKADAQRMAEVLLEFKLDYINGAQHYQRARVLAAMGDAQAAVTALNRSFHEGYGWVPGAIHRDTAFDPIRKDKAFQDFCANKDSPVGTPGSHR